MRDPSVRSVVRCALGDARGVQVVREVREVHEDPERRPGAGKAVRTALSHPPPSLRTRGPRDEAEGRQTVRGRGPGKGVEEDDPVRGARWRDVRGDGDGRGSGKEAGGAPGVGVARRRIVVGSILERGEVQQV